MTSFAAGLARGSDWSPKYHRGKEFCRLVAIITDIATAALPRIRGTRAVGGTFVRLCTPSGGTYLPLESLCSSMGSGARHLAPEIIPNLIKVQGPKMCSAERGKFLRSLYTWITRDFCPRARTTKYEHFQFFGPAAKALIEFDILGEQDPEKRALYMIFTRG